MVQCISSKQYSGGGPCRLFIWPINLLVEHIAGPPTAIVQLKALNVLIKYLSSVALFRDHASHDEFAGFGYGNPRLFLNASATQCRFDKGILFLTESGAGLIACNYSG